MKLNELTEALYGKGDDDEPPYPPAEPITRDAFLYLEPSKTPEDDFAQCASCRLFVPEDRCVILGSRVKVATRASCGFYVPWPEGVPEAHVVAGHKAELDAGLLGSVTPDIAGLVFREVRCENCAFFEDTTSECDLYEKLNALPWFDLDVKVEPYGCCNAQTPGEEDGEKD